MYFWNTQKLIEDIQQQKLTEKDYKNYYIGSAVMILMAFLGINISPAVTTHYAFAEFICQLGLLMTAVNLIYKANGGDQGQDFLNRFVALYFPITIKMTVVGIVLGLMWGIIAVMFGWAGDGETPQNITEEIIELSMTVILTAFTYWRIYVAMQKLQHSIKS